MDQTWGIILVIFTLFMGWLMQVIVTLFPSFASKYGLIEPGSGVDPAFFADAQGEAIWDSLSLWVLPVAGILLLLDSAYWAYFGLVGGGMYVYFAGRGIVVRRLMQRRGIAIGNPDTLKLFYAFLILWGLIGLVTIYLAVSDLPLL
ncbi:MAG: hypothetical protein ACK2T3_14155 [Candidatus Promineifilaceae bacterium]|jgi:hypothetical protein